AVRLRTAGTFFHAQFALSDPRALLARQLAPTIIEGLLTFDERLAAFDALASGNLKVGEHAQTQLSVYAPPVLQTLKDVAKLCEGAIVSSSVEHARLERHLGYLPFGIVQTPQREAALPPHGDSKPRVVIWAPLLHARETALLAFALEELHVPVTVVCREGEIPSLHAEYVAYDVSLPLPAASVIVDACIDHAGNALAFAERGYPVVCATSSGAVEYLEDVLLYDPWNHRSVFSAVTTALGAVASRVRTIDHPAFAAPAVVEDGPLVSMVIRTYDRRAFLPRALESLSRQTYKKLEIIVVNDGGPDVSDIIAGFDNVRYLLLERNGGTSAAANAGLHAARGKYIGFLDDDDIVFPEHVSVLVSALERSGAEVAHTDTIAAHFEKDDAGQYFVTGYIVFLDGLVEPTDFYVTDGVGPMSVLMKRSLAISAGGYNETITHAEDWDLYLNLSQHFDFIHVPRVTGVYSIRHDGTHMMSNSGKQIADSMEKLMQRYPLPHRPIMETARRTSLQGYRDSGYKMRFPEPALKRQ
ncbi:MAG: glycosyltransferase family 2 protein, partial [Candidatus Baltobacteraceae bacterium]